MLEAIAELVIMLLVNVYQESTSRIPSWIANEAEDVIPTHSRNRNGSGTHLHLPICEDRAGKVGCPILVCFLSPLL